MIHGAVSRQTVLAMAGNLRNISNSDMSIAISGIAGPSGGTSGKPVGTVFIGLSTVKKTTAKKPAKKASVKKTPAKKKAAPKKPAAKKKSK